MHSRAEIASGGASEGRWRILILTALCTGLRQGELLGLKWTDIDQQSSRSYVRRQ